MLISPGLETLISMTPVKFSTTETVLQRLDPSMHATSGLPHGKTFAGREYTGKPKVSPYLSENPN